MLTFAVVAIAFGHTITGGWLWDDELLVASPRLMRGLEGLRRIWMGDGTLDYFPLTSTTFWLERQLTDQPWLPRVDNLMLHATAACLIGTLALRLRVPHGRFVGLLFAVHPLVVSSAAWVSERKNTLSLCLGVASLILTLPAAREWPTRRELAIATALFVLALLAKTQLVGLPIVLAMCLWLRGTPPREVWIAIGAMLGCALGLGLLTITFQDAVPQHDAGGVVVRVVRAADAIAFQLAHTAWPSGLTMLYARDAVSGEGVRGWIALVVLLVLAAALGWASTTKERARWARPALVMLASYVVLLAPTLGLIDMSFMRFAFVADHFGYAALPVVIVGLVLSTSFLPRQAALAALSIVCVLLGVASRDHASAFTSLRALWTQNVEVVPRAGAAHGNLALALQADGQTRDALREAREAVRLWPNDAEMHCFLGVVLLQQMAAPEAQRELEIALALDPELARAHNNLASALVVQGRVEEGITHLRAALEIEPDYALGHMNLARLLASRGEMEEAEREQAIAIDLDPSMRDVPLLPPAPAP
ncbi:MAG: tetratricopeptide repeat protein [Deltaproteobacteria bacterium]|nr:tetratricopeptide repeat protein [Deltaproteobacteria bacterium]